MSFHFEFNAKEVAEAEKLLAKEIAPYLVKAFISLALKCHIGHPVHVKASGHLNENDGSWGQTTANILVERIEFKEIR